MELSATWSARSHWKLGGAYSWLRVRLDPEVTRQPLDALSSERGNPEHQAHLRSSWNLPGRLELDCALYRVGTLSREAGRARQDLIPAYTRVDARLGWRPASRFELSVNAENLLDPRHTEFRAFDSYVVPGEQIQRSLYGRFTWRFSLVMIDGRRVYTPVLGGVYWDLQDVLLEDVERIEVIRGPGATLDRLLAEPVGRSV